MPDGNSTTDPSGRGKIDVSAIRELKLSGMTQKDIAERLGVTPAAISQALKRAASREDSPPEGAPLKRHKNGQFYRYFTACKKNIYFGCDHDEALSLYLEERKSLELGRIPPRSLPSLL